MTKSISVHDIMIRLGVFRALYASAVQFNSVLFRLIVGVLAVFSGVPADTVALVTMIEFLLNGILDVPFGWLADRIGRIPSIASSLILIMTGLTCVYIALLLNNEASRYLFIAHGILIGLAKPLGSGSIEAFYQDALKRCCQNATEEKMLLTSLTTSQNHGKYYTTIAVVVSFLLTWIFNRLEWLPHTFLFGILLYASCIVTLLRDYAQLGDREKHLQSSTTREIFQTILMSSRAKISLVYNLSFWILGVIMAGYLIISFGRELRGSPGVTQWAFMVAFMLGYSAFGWVFKGHVLPFLIHRITQRNYLLVSYGLTFAMSLGFLALYQSAPLIIQVGYIFVFGVVFHTATAAIQNLSMNQLMAEVKKQDYSTALSFQNIPGYITVGLYSIYLTFMRSGAPSVREAFVSVAVLSILFALFVISVEKSSSPRVENVQ